MPFLLTNFLKKDIYPLFKQIRFKSQRRCLGKPPGVARNLETRLQEINFKDPKLYFKVDIGFPQTKQFRKEVLQNHIAILKKNRTNKELEQLARDNKLIIPLDKVKDEWVQTLGPLQIKEMAEHYLVFEHLYGDAYFIPSVHLEINFENINDICPVYYGNHVKPEQAKSVPIIKFEAPEDSLWTLVMTTPDGHFTDMNSEYVHWFVGNIKGSDIQKGDIIHNYLQPFPVKGLGYYRYVFVLYKQTEMLDYSSLVSSSKSSMLETRTFSTYEFYKERQNVLTPASLAFFQAEWDNSVTEIFHNALRTQEPEYCYDFPEPYYRKQEWFPLGRPFNLYLDRYRDEKQIAKEYLIKKLKMTHPFKGPMLPLKFPNAIPFKKGTPSWLKLEMRKERLKWGRVNDY